MTIDDDIWLITPRGLALRRLRAGDLDRLHEVHSDPATYRHHPDGRWRSLEQARTRLAEWTAHWEHHGFGYAAVQPAGSDTVLGFVGVQHQTLFGQPVLNLYYRFDPAAWGHGYARESAWTVLGEIQRREPWIPVVARIAVNNPASARLARSIGLELEQTTDPNDPIPHHLFSTASLTTANSPAEPPAAPRRDETSTATRQACAR